MLAATESEWRWEKEDSVMQARNGPGSLETMTVSLLTVLYEEDW